MPARARRFPLVLRSAVFAAAVLALLLAPDPPESPAGPGAGAAAVRVTGTPASRHDPPSPARIGLVMLLFAGAALDARQRRLPWR